MTRASSPDSAEAAVRRAEQVSHDWDEALGAEDVDRALALYAPDATLESPLVRYHLGIVDGVVRGHDDLRRFVSIVFERQPPERRRYRSAPFTDGHSVIWEYPRATPDGEQMDFVEVMELDDAGLIQYHRVSWGWFGLRLLDRQRSV
jgi:SnoaL-like domain